MRLSLAEYLTIQARIDSNSVRRGTEPVERESDLHNDIIAHCNAQWPRWKFIHCRTDRRSTIAIGAPDFVIFLPHGRVLCLECKRKNAKPTTEQIAWQKEMQLLGHAVHVVRSMEEFQKLI